MMNRMSVTFSDEIEDLLRTVQGELIKNFKRDFSFTTVVHIVLMAGVLGVPHLKDKDWHKIREYVEKNQINLDAEGVTDNFVNSLK